MELKIYLSILLKKWWIVIPTFLVTLTAGMVLTYTQSPIYRATTTYVVAPSPVMGDAKSFANGLDMLGRRDEIATTFAEIASSRSIKEAATNSISLASGRDYTITGKLRAGTNIIELMVQGPDPIVTRDLANTIGSTTEAYVKDSYEVFVLRSLDKAVTPTSPIRPNPLLNLSLTAILGLVLGAGLAFLSTYLETPTRSMAETVSMFDEQIGVFNKDYFMMRLGDEMVRAKRNQYPLSVALMRVDNLELLKGNNSAKVRSEMLQQVASRASRQLREEDIIAFYGDETFALLLPDMTGEKAKTFIEELQTQIGWLPFQSTSNGTAFNLKSIFGIAAYDHNNTSRDDLVAQADRALHLAAVHENGNVYLIADTHTTDYPHA